MEDIPRKLCPSCGVQVTPFIMYVDGDEVMRCPNCGMNLHDISEGQPLRTLEKVIIAEDSKALVNRIAQILEEHRMAEWVTKCEDGAEFITRLTEHFQQKRNVNLVILDINMPIVNGVNAAIAMRAIEKGYEMPKPIPILFFTAKQCDETFKKVLGYTKPAKYINKGTGNSPDEFADRLYKVLTHLLQR